jgi:hypothetical protein
MIQKTFRLTKLFGFNLRQDFNSKRIFTDTETNDVTQFKMNVR